MDANEVGGQSVVSGTVTVTGLEKLADQEYRHVVRLAGNEQLLEQIKDIQETLHSIKARFHPAPFIFRSALPPQQPCVNIVNCPVETGSDSWLKKRLQEIEQKIDNLKPSDSSVEARSTERCLFRPTASQQKQNDLAQDTQNITACVSNIIAQMRNLELAVKGASSTSGTTLDACPLKITGSQEQAADDLTECVEELLKHARQLKPMGENVVRTWQVALEVPIGCFIVLVVSLGIYRLITRFMKDHYEWPNEHDNIFMIEGVPQLLSNSAEQISEEERHYSNLRFALFTIFMATSGALGALHLNKEYVESTRLIHNELPIIGLLMTIAFASLEFAIDWIETEYRYMANAVWRYYRQHLLSGTQPNNSLSVGGASIEISWVRGPIWGIFVLAALTWTFLAAPTNPTDSFIPYIPYILAWCIVGISILFFWYFLKTKGRPHADELSVKLISNR